MTTPAPHTLSAQVRRRLAQLRSRLLAHPLATSVGVALFVLTLRRLLSQLRRRLPTTTAGLPAPRFVLDAHEDFHAFVFSSDGICIAHGREPSFVGKSLQQVFTNEEIEDSADMHERFLRAAAAGGGWCTYSWRTSPAVLRLKGAYIFGVDLGGGKHGYAGGILGVALILKLTLTLTLARIRTRILTLTRCGLRAVPAGVGGAGARPVRLRVQRRGTVPRARHPNPNPGTPP